MTNRTHVICTVDGEHIATCTRDAARKLQDKSMVRPHRRRGSTWLAPLESAAMIRAELRRKIIPDLPVAEDNYTIRRVRTYFEFKDKITAAYRRLAA